MLMQTEAPLISFCRKSVLFTLEWQRSLSALQKAGINRQYSIWHQLLYAAVDAHPANKLTQRLGR
jgi:hypothetical protein